MRVNPAAPVYYNRFYTGWISQRNKLAIPIRIFGRRVIELYDAILTGSNMELNNFLTLQRRPGYVQYNSNAITGTVLNGVTFQPTGQIGCFPVIDTTTGTYLVQPSGGAPTTLITKSGTSAESTFFGVGAYLYVGNPNSAPVKVDAFGNVTNMGISVGSNADSTTEACTTGAQVGGAPTWTNPTDVASNNPSTPATFTGTYSELGGGFLVAETFSFSIPATTQVTGIQVEVSGSQTLQTPSTGIRVFLDRNNGTQPTSRYPVVGQLPSANGTITLGSQSAQWGVFGGSAALLSLVNSTTFAVDIQPPGGQSGTWNVYYVEVIVYGIGGPTVTPTGSGSLTTQNGWIYAYAYGNSSSGGLSNLTPVSSSTGAFSNKDEVTVALVASTDPQVNQINVFRTTDGGPSTIMYELPNSPFPNTTTNIEDTALDTSLSIYSVATTPGLNNPPPTGISGFEWYAGRLWGFVGNLLYFSSGPDSISGNAPENWYPNYVYELPTTIVRLISLGASGMLVFTLDKIHIVQGNSTQTFTVNIYASKVGARQYNAIAVDGANIYVFTSDRQLLCIGPSGTTEPGSQIGDQLDNLDPTLVYLTVHRSGSQDQILAISDGTTNIYTFNLSQEAWNPLQTPVGGVQAIMSLEVTPGVFKFLMGSPNAGQVLLQRDLATFADNGTAYPCNVTFGNIQFADPGQLADMEGLYLESSKVTSTPVVGVLMNDISGTFSTLTNPRTEPTSISIPTPQSSYKSQVWYLKTGDKKYVTEALRHLQFQFSWPAEAVKEEIFGICLAGPADTGGTPAPQPQIQGR